MIDAVAEARQLIGIVAGDRKLPRYARREASSMELLASLSPGLVFDRLGDLRHRVISDLKSELESPTVDYVRCVSVEVFWRYHVRPARRALFRSRGLEWRP